MTKAEELLPCPFCGSKDISLWTGFGTQADIMCEDCCCERNVQVIDMREDGEDYPAFDEATCRYPDWLIERTNNHLITEWNTRLAAQADAQGGEVVWLWRAAVGSSWNPWKVLDMSVEKFRASAWSYNLENGTAELKQFYATQPLSIEAQRAESGPAIAPASETYAAFGSGEIGRGTK